MSNETVTIQVELPATQEFEGQLYVPVAHRAVKAGDVCSSVYNCGSLHSLYRTTAAVGEVNRFIWEPVEPVEPAEPEVPESHEYPIKQAYSGSLYVVDFVSAEGHVMETLGTVMTLKDNHGRTFNGFVHVIDQDVSYSADLFQWDYNKKRFVPASAIRFTKESV